MTSIEWTEKTWNPVRGCSRVSPGCDHCYAMGQAHRYSGPGKPYDGLTTIRRGKVDWTGRAVLVPGQLEVPLKRRKPTTWFVNSMSDLFHESLTNEEIAAVFGVMAACPQHTFQVLTKRPRRMRRWFQWVSNCVAPPRCIVQRLAQNLGGRFALGTPPFRPAALVVSELVLVEAPWPLPNVWLGVSAEDQQRADERIPLLLETPAALRFVSAEPLLGPIDLKRYAAWPWFCERCQVVPESNAETHLHCHDEGRVVRRTIDWVIVGGESGPGARPCNVAWIRSIVEQCKTAGVAAFVKQLGALPVFPQGAQRLIDRKGGDPSEWPEDVRVREMSVPASAAGRP